MTSTSDQLTRKQLVFFIAFGVAGWLVAALLLRVLGPTGIYEGGLRVWVYALIIPGTMPFVWLAARLGKAQAGQLYPGFALSSGIATLCDGIALAWFPTLYGATVQLHAGAGGTILWGVGVGIVLAYVMDRAPFTAPRAQGFAYQPHAAR
ncbi:hypothetical protein [Sulfitobacter sp. JB4-11]|uniref:hypothetical protein n=1 Tax=Sulfitobacter rhodophyticola TaxID=3238304 RepID=UPI0035120401